MDAKGAPPGGVPPANLANELNQVEKILNAIDSFFRV